MAVLQTSEHQTKCELEIQTILSSTQCGKCETQPVKAFCQQCQEFICNDCQALHLRWRELRSHEIIAINDGAQFHDALLATQEAALLIFSVIKQKLGTIENAYKKFDAREKEIVDKQNEVEAIINQEVNFVIKKVEQQKAQLIDSLKHETRGVMCKLTEERKQVEEVQKMLSSSLHTAISSFTNAQKRDEMMTTARDGVDSAKALLSEMPLQPTVRPYMALIDMEGVKMACSSFGRISNVALCAEKSFASGDGLKFARIGESLAVTIHPKDNQGNEYTKQVQITAELIHCCTMSSDAPCTVEMQSKSQYSVTYKALQTGKHSLQLCIKNSEGEPANIQGSPFAISVHATSLFFESAEHSHILRELKSPTGIATNTRGDIVVVEQGKHCITVFSADYTRITSFGNQKTSEDQLWSPNSVAIDHNDNIYVTDGENHVQKFTSNGMFIAKIGSKGTGELEFKNLMGIAYNSLDGRIYVCDSDNSRIVILNPDLTFHDSFTTKEERLSYPLDIAFDHSGHIYVTEYYTFYQIKYYVVHKYLPSKESMKIIEMQSNTLGIAFDSGDTMLLTEVGKSSVIIYDINQQSVCENKTSSQGSFKGPRAIHVDTKDKIYIADTGNNRVHIFH